MKKLRLSMLTAAMICGAMLTTQTKAQTGPCGWDLTTEINQPTCYKLCNGSISVVPTVNWAFEYLWSDGSTQNMISGLCENEYTVTVTDDKKCAQTYTYSIVEPAEVVASCVTLTNESSPYAWDGSILASAVGGDGNYTFEWQTNPVTTGALLSNAPAGNYTVIVYDGKDCTASTSCTIYLDKKEEECEGFRTQTQGGWGQCQQTGNNPGTYLFANFAAAFPNGLVIGCGSRHLTLTSAQAVCDFLPSGTTPKVLPAGANLINPSQSYRNVFAGQLVAATLNARFDVYDPNFASNESFTLGEMIIASGSFANWTVNDLIAEANRKIGGCASPYGASALSDALEDVNENYVDGSIDNGFLVCPETKKDDRTYTITSENLSVKVFPNPVNSISNISVYSEIDQHMTVDIYNISGQKVNSIFNADVNSGDFTMLSFDATNLNNGVYFIRIVTENDVLNQKVIVNK